MTNEAESSKLAAYKERARIQCLTWARGRSYHDEINDECCPDFSCCFPELFEKDDSKRLECYHQKYGQKQ